MASLVTLQTAITKCKASLTQLNTQLADLSTTALSIGTTADTTGALEQRINIITNNFGPIAKEVADIKAALAS